MSMPTAHKSRRAFLRTAAAAGPYFTVSDVLAQAPAASKAPLPAAPASSEEEKVTATKYG